MTSKGVSRLFAFVEQNPNGEVIKILLNDAKKNGVSLINRKDPNGETALSLAATLNPNPAVIKFLIDSGADVHTRDRNKAGPVSHAKLSKHFGKAPRRDEVIKILLEKINIPCEVFAGEFLYQAKIFTRL